MAQQLKNNNSQQNGENIKPVCQTKISKELKSKEMNQKKHLEPDQGREKLKHRIYKRIKRVGVWVLSFVSSFLCGAFVAFVLWWTHKNIDFVFDFWD